MSSLKNLGLSFDMAVQGVWSFKPIYYKFVLYKKVSLFIVYSALDKTSRENWLDASSGVFTMNTIFVVSLEALARHFQ